LIVEALDLVLEEDDELEHDANFTLGSVLRLQLFGE
jgi:hypothetical protein